MGINEMADTIVGANQEELLKVRANPAGLEEPENSLDSHIHDAFRRLF